MIFARGQRTWHRQLKGAATRRAATFQHLNTKPSALGSRHAQAQRRRRGLAGHATRPKQESQTGTFGGGYLQAAYLTGVDAR